MILYDDKLKIIHMTGKHMSLPNNHARFAALNAAFVQVAHQIIQSSFYQQSYNCNIQLQIIIATHKFQLRNACSIGFARNR